MGLGDGEESSLFWVEGLAGFEDSVDLVKELSHERDDDLFGFLAILFESVSEGLEQWIEDSRIHCWHEESTAQIGRSDFGDGGAVAAGSAAYEVSWCHSGPSGELACRTEEANFGKLGEEDLAGDLSQTGDASQELALMAHELAGSNERLDAMTNVGELLLLGFDPSF